uniref:Ovule protein n=1 Tax=Heterorhabditis bacteriophora TaxID=37862 RepID=A0A1I7WE04_HETBA
MDNEKHNNNTNKKCGFQFICNISFSFFYINIYNLTCLNTFTCFFFQSQERLLEIRNFIDYLCLPTWKNCSFILFFDALFFSIIS